MRLYAEVEEEMEGKSSSSSSSCNTNSNSPSSRPTRWDFWGMVKVICQALISSLQWQQQLRGNKGQEGEEWLKEGKLHRYHHQTRWEI